MQDSFYDPNFNSVVASNRISTVNNTSQMHIPSEFLTVSDVDADELAECQRLLRDDMYFNYPY
jgi:hypothetical protein